MKFHINLEVQLLLKQGQVSFFDELRHGLHNLKILVWVHGL